MRVCAAGHLAIAPDEADQSSESRKAKPISAEENAHFCTVCASG